MLPKILIATGAAIIAVGLILIYAPWLLSWFGRLPGDINIQRGNTRVFFPLTSLIIVSLALNLLIHLFLRR